MGLEKIAFPQMRGTLIRFIPQKRLPRQLASRRPPMKEPNGEIEVAREIEPQEKRVYYDGRIQSTPTCSARAQDGYRRGARECSKP